MSATRPPQQTYPQQNRRAVIHSLLLQKKYPNCASIAKLFEVSPKTVMRTLEHMRSSDRLPIEYDVTKRGYYYTEDVVNFPEVTITEGEYFALLIAQRALEQYRGTPLEKRLTQSFQKITAQLKDEITFDVGEAFDGISFRSPGAAVTSIAVFDVLASCLRKKRAADISYLKGGQSTPSSRRVHPYHLACFRSSWYLVAFDSKRNDVITFALSRIKEVSATRDLFTRPKDFSAEKYFGDSFGIFTGNDLVDVAIEFSSSVSAVVQEREWHRSQSFTRLPGGGVCLNLKVSRLEEIKNWVLSWGRHAKVVAPASLAATILDEASATREQYAGIASLSSNAIGRSAAEEVPAPEAVCSADVVSDRKAPRRKTPSSLKSRAVANGR